MDAGLVLKQPLLKDSWIDKERQQIKLNKNQLKTSEIGLRGSMMRVITDVQFAYYELLYARENIRVEQKALELANQLLTETRAKVRVGDMTQLQEQQAQVHVEMVSGDLLSAEQSFAQQQNVVKQYLADDFNAWWGVEINPTDSLVAVPEQANRIESINNALTKRPDVLQMQLELQRQSIILKYNHNQMFPSLDLTGSIGIRSANRDIDRALEDLGDIAHPFYGFGATLSIPLGNTGARNNYKASQLAREQAVTRLKQLENSVLADVQSSLSITDTSYKRVNSTRKARQVREAMLDAAQKELQAGAQTNLGVLEALNAVTAARLQEIRALADYNKARAKLAYDQGVTLEKNFLSVEIR
jgi:outer membrane protein TolC